MAGQLILDYPGSKTNWAMDRAAGLWKRRFTYRDFAAAGTTNDVDLPFPGGLTIEGAFIWLVETFAGGNVATGTASAGTTGNSVAYVTTSDVLATAPAVYSGVALDPGIFLNQTSPNALGTVRVELITDVNSDLLTAGAFDLYLKLRGVALKPVLP